MHPGQRLVGNDKIWVLLDDPITVYVNAQKLFTRAARSEVDTHREMQNIKEVLYFAITRPQKLFNLVIDMQNTKLSNVDRKFLLHIANELKKDRELDDTLNTCTVLNSNAAVEILFDMISCLLDKETKKKINLVKAPKPESARKSLPS